MNEKSKNQNNLVALASGDTPQNTVKKGFDLLGDVSNFIKKDDTIFIKVNLRVPELFPATFNFDTLSQLIQLCKIAGAQKIVIGSYSDEDIKAEAFEKLLEFKTRIEALGAEFIVFQDNMNIEYIHKDIGQISATIPKVIIESSKLISLNQIRVNPVFQLDLSLLNSYSMISPKLRIVKKSERIGKDYLLSDQYKQDLVSNILEVYNIRKPNIIINDLYYLVEKAGPYIFKDSNLKRTNMMVLGTDALAVDIITLTLLNLDYLQNPLTSAACIARLGISDFKDIQIVGENLEKKKLEILLPKSELEDIGVLNTIIKPGNYCSGCFEAAYRFLNFMKTYMVKDLKYLINQSFLIGNNPAELDSSENLLIFGDCAINSTKSRNFRKVMVKSDEIIKSSLYKLLKKDKKPTEPKLKEEINNKVLELSGCPPNFYQTLYQFVEFYGKKDCPNGSFCLDLVKLYLEEKTSEA